jgi:hypothetical protein
MRATPLLLVFVTAGLAGAAVRAQVNPAVGGEAPGSEALQNSIPPAGALPQPNPLPDTAATMPTVEAPTPQSVPPPMTSAPETTEAPTAAAPATTPEETAAAPATNAPAPTTNTPAPSMNTPPQTVNANPSAMTFTAPEVATTVQGTVTEVNPARGEVFVQGAEADYVVSGLPGQISELQPGASVELPFDNISGYYWLPAPKRAPPPSAPIRELTGVVGEVDPARGLLTVGRVVVRGRPDMLVAFVPGQTVIMGIETIGNVNWLRAIDRTSPG